MSGRKYPSTRYYTGPYPSVYVTLDGRRMRIARGESVAVTSETAKELDTTGSWATKAADITPAPDTTPAPLATDSSEETS